MQRTTSAGFSPPAVAFYPEWDHSPPTSPRPCAAWPAAGRATPSWPNSSASCPAAARSSARCAVSPDRDQAHAPPRGRGARAALRDPGLRRRRGTARVGLRPRARLAVGGRAAHPRELGCPTTRRGRRARRVAYRPATHRSTSWSNGTWDAPASGQQAVPRRDDVRRLGQHRPRRLDPDHPRARWTPGSTSSTPPTSTRRASPRRSSARRSPAGAATTSCSPRSSAARWATTRTTAASRGAGSSRRSRTRCAGCRPTGSTSTRCTAPTPETDIDETLGALTDLVQQGKIRYFGSSTFPASRIVEAQWTARERGPGALPHRAAAVLDPRARHRGRRAADLRSVTAWACSPWSPLSGGWLSGKWRKGAEDLKPTSAARQRLAARYDLSLPENQRKLDAADALAQLADEAGLTLIEMAIAFVGQPPGGHVGDHRSADDGAARITAARRGGRPRRGGARPDRRDRPAGDEHQPC